MPLNQRQKKAIIAYLGGMFLVFGVLSAPRAITFENILVMIFSPASFIIAVFAFLYAFRR